MDNRLNNLLINKKSLFELNDIELISDNTKLNNAKLDEDENSFDFFRIVPFILLHEHPVHLNVSRDYYFTARSYSNNNRQYVSIVQSSTYNAMSARHLSWRNEYESQAIVSFTLRVNLNDDDARLFWEHNHASNINAARHDIRTAISTGQAQTIWNNIHNNLEFNHPRDINTVWYIQL